MDSTELIAIAAITVVVALILVVSWQLTKLRGSSTRRRPDGTPMLPGGDFRLLEDGSWEVFLVRDAVHRENFEAIRAERPDDVRMDVELVLAGKARRPEVVVLIDDAEVGRLHSAVAAALAPVLVDGAVSGSGRVRTRTSKRSGGERSSLSVVVPATTVAAAGYVKR